MLKHGFIGGFCLALAAAQGGPIPSNTFGVATGYNAFVFNNFVDTCCDVAGNLAVGGTITVANFAVGQSYYSGSASGVPYSYVGMGALTGSFSLDAGNGYYAPGGIFNGATNYQANGGGAIYLNNGAQTISSTGGSGIDFAAAHASLSNYSTFLYGVASTTTPTAHAGGGYNISAQNTSQTNIVILTAQQLAAGALHIDIANGASLLINVVADLNGSASTSNAGIFINGVQPAGDGAAGANNIVFNFVGSNTFTANETIIGTVLAPNATYAGTGHQLDGGIIANNVSGATEFHDDLFTGTLPVQVAAAPEPLTFLLLSSGLALLGAIRKRR